MSRPLAVITGGSSGIGEVFARRLAKSHDLLLIARHLNTLQPLADELIAQHGGTVDVVAAGLSDPQAVASIAERTAGMSSLQLLIHTAGFGFPGLFWEADLEVLEKMHRLHILALVRLSHAALKVMVKQNRGAIVNLASVASFVQRPRNASYGATKSWVAAFTEGLDADLKKAQSAVRVQALCPGYTFSHFHDALGVDRMQLAPRSFWLSADEVVDASLRALAQDQVFVIPNWRY